MPNRSANVSPTPKDNKTYLQHHLAPMQLLWSFAMLSYNPACVERLVEQLQGMLPNNNTASTPAQLASSSWHVISDDTSETPVGRSNSSTKQQPLEWPDVCTALWSLSSLDLLDADPQLTRTLVSALNCTAAAEKGATARPNFPALIRRLEPFQQKQLLQVVDALALHGWVPMDTSSPQLPSSALSSLATMTQPNASSSETALTSSSETASASSEEASPAAAGSTLSVHPELLAALWGTRYTEKGEEPSRRRNSNDGGGEQSDDDDDESAAGRAEEQKAAAVAVARDVGRVLGWMIKQQDVGPARELELTRVMLGAKALDAGMGVGKKAGIECSAPMLLSMGSQGVAQSTAVLTLSDGSNVVLFVDGADVAMRNLEENPEVVDGIGSLRDLILVARFGVDYVVTLHPEQLLEHDSIADKAFMVQEALGM